MTDLSRRLFLKSLTAMLALPGALAVVNKIPQIQTSVAKAYRLPVNATLKMENRVITAVNIINPGSGYTHPPTITFS